MLALLAPLRLAKNVSPDGGTSYEFECGRFDFGHRCSADEKVEEDLCSKGLQNPCCRSFEIDFSSGAFEEKPVPPVVLASVLRPPELAHATFSVQITRKAESAHQKFTATITREDYCDHATVRSWCARVELLWMAYGVTQKSSADKLAEYRHPMEAEVDYVPYLKKFPYRRPGEAAAMASFRHPLPGTPAASQLRKGEAHSHQISRVSAVGNLAVTRPVPRRMYIKAINPTVLVAALDKRDESTTVSLLHGGGAIVGVVPTECAWGTCAQPGDLLAPVPAKLQGCAEAPQFARRLDGALRVDLRGFPPVLEGYHLCHAARSDCPPPDLPDKCGAKHFTMQCPGDADSGQCTGPPHVLPVRDAREAPQEVNPEQAKVLVKAANAEIVARQKELAPMRQLLQFRLGAAGGAPAGDELRVAVNDDGAVAPLVLAVYERGVRLAVGDWLAVVPKDLTNRCRGARKAAMRLRGPNWEAGPFTPPPPDTTTDEWRAGRTATYDVCWAPGTGDTDPLTQPKNGEAGDSTPAKATAPKDCEFFAQEVPKLMVKAPEGKEIDVPMGTVINTGSNELERRMGNATDEAYARFVSAAPVHHLSTGLHRPATRLRRGSGGAALEPPPDPRT